MAFRGLVEGECGGNNSLVQLASIVARDNAINSRPSGSQAEQYVEEFIMQNQGPPPQTFQMNALLHSLRDIQEPGSSASHSHQWVGEFNNFTKQGGAPVPWDSFTGPMPRFPMMMPHQPGRLVGRPAMPLEYLDDEQTHNLIEQGTVTSMVQDEQQNQVQEKARELVDAVVDQNLAYSEFLTFMKKVGGGEIPIEIPQADNSTNSMTFSTREEQLEKMAENYKEEWAKLSDVKDHTWLSQFNQNTNPFTEYLFTQDNSMSDNVNALEIGKEKLKLGDVPGAVLCFEAAVKQDPTSVESWLLLGTTQAENEQDPQAIAALVKCVQLNPTCLPAYMALGASYTNENYPNLAYQSFNNWLKANPKYSDLVPLDIDVVNMNNNLLQNHIQSLFIRAVQMNPSVVDPDIQSALGVLFNISQEYDKAVDCFKTALMVKVDDSRLWNRLGATLANGDRSEEAVDAYHHALSLEPGFIRARYNVGITCMNLGAHKEAAEHFLCALNQQAKARGVSPSPNISTEDSSSSTIWSTLRMVCAFMGKHQLMPLIDTKDLNALNKQFGLE